MDKISANGFVCKGDSLRGEPSRAHVDCCRKWIRRRCVKTRAIQRRFSSYQFKHWVENTLIPKKVNYVSNGAFIAAAILEGYRAERIQDGPNARFNIKVVALVGLPLREELFHGVLL